MIFGFFSDNIGEMMSDTYVNEVVTVWVFFDRGIFPIAMNWRRRLVKFQKLVFTSSKKVGEVKIVSLVCATEGANYELEYNSLDQSWKLKKVMPRD